MWSGSTIGNNVVAHTGTSLLDHTAEDADMNLTFDYLYDASLPATDLNNLDAARVNAWYVGNVVRDFAWKYGFRPLTFNFQADTLQDKWARGDDPVPIRVQTTPGVNDAVFTTPPDGSAGVLKLYVWNKANPT
ncbi:hypothetical protein FA13DRAFT_1791445 [Coprinellus micaceus]|uniref:Extracellular metalloproteinase n=1 Tax=Coprinellus micaceus TaxID=71717 RepID=A0A4Y7TBY3_COPMI|nr:hypothetical protein FA13DRAFT_1791445 [Coprinellus micaceus]